MNTKVPEWKVPLYENGKTPDQKTVDKAAEEYRRSVFRLALSDKEVKK